MQLLFVFFTLALGSADVYRWVDADGQAHYSDRPRSGAERITIDVSPPTGVPAQTGSRDASAGAASNDFPEPVTGYESLTITTPTQDQVIWNIEGQLDVAAAVQPALQPGHALEFNLDGRRMPAEPGQTQARFPGVFRGEHALRVDVVDAAGQSLISSAATRFFVRQTSIADSPPARPPARLPAARP